MLGWLKRLFAPSKPQSAGRTAGLAKYDAAVTNDDNRAHWANADGLSANAANNPEVRRVLRNRARYEDGNNPHVAGLTQGYSAEGMGTGPRLQLQISGPDVDFGTPVPSDLPRQIEERWKEWCKAVGLTDELHTAAETYLRDGEVFAFTFVNPGLAHPVQLALRLYEGDQIATPDRKPDQPVDGIVFDQAGNPVEYHVLKEHPGDVSLRWGPLSGYDRIPARQICHLFHRRRPGQARGVPALSPSLPGYAILRRYTLACLLSAEAQARINGVIESEHFPAEEDEDPTGQQIQYAGTHLLHLGAGETAKVLPHSSPPPNHREFRDSNLTDGGRSVCAPRNISTGSSAEYNYSSGRLDTQGWQRVLRVYRDRVERRLLDWIFRQWAALALLTPDYLPAGTPPVDAWRWKWRWDGFGSIDPTKDAKAATERLANGTSSLDRECGELGEDWEDVQDQRLAEEARELRRRTELGLPPKAITPAPGAAPAVATEVEDDA
ncbi:MAG: phage portal protein [Gemmataceae bacterium]